MSKARLPTVTSPIPNDLRRFLDRIGEVVATTGEDRFVTVRELAAANVVGSDPNGDITTPTLTNDNDIVLRCDRVNNLRALGGFEFITLFWDRSETFGLNRAEIWYSFTPDAVQDIERDALFAGSTRATVFSHQVGTNATGVGYWVRFVTENGEKCGFSEAVTESTAYDVVELLDALEDRIGRSQLASELANVYDRALDRWIVNVNADGVAGGFGILSSEDEVDGLPNIDFAVAADTFFIVPPVSYNLPGPPSGAADGQVWRNSTDGTYYIRNNGSWEQLNVPFIVQSTPTTIIRDGEEVEVPAGVYVNSAFIRAATIDTAMIREAAIDTAAIQTAAITNAKIDFLDAATIQTGEFRSWQFTNTSGEGGWLLNLGVTLEVDEETGEQIVNTAQIDPYFVIRSSEFDQPAIELSQGVVRIAAANIIGILQSDDYPQRGFEFDIGRNRATFRDNNGNIMLRLDGRFEGVSGLVQDQIDAAIADAAAAAGDASEANQAAIQAQLDANTANELAGRINGNLDPFERDENGNIIGLDVNTVLIQNADERLSALAFVERFTSATEVNAFFDSVAIVEAIIGNLVVGTANIEEAAITSAQIGDASVDSLQIAGNAVTIPVGNDGGSGATVSTGWQDIGDVTLAWSTANENASGPESIVVSGQVNFLGTSPSGNADSATMSARFEARSSNGGLAYSGEVGQSFRNDFGGSTSVSGEIEVPSSWAPPITITLQATASSSGGARTAASFSMFALGAKR